MEKMNAKTILVVEDSANIKHSQRRIEVTSSNIKKIVSELFGDTNPSKSTRIKMEFILLEFPEDTIFYVDKFMSVYNILGDVWVEKIWLIVCERKYAQKKVDEIEKSLETDASIFNAHDLITYKEGLLNRINDIENFLLI